MAKGVRGNVLMHTSQAYRTFNHFVNGTLIKMMATPNTTARIF
jgi:hypothetical protein